MRDVDYARLVAAVGDHHPPVGAVGDPRWRQLAHGYRRPEGFEAVGVIERDRVALAYDDRGAVGREIGSEARWLRQRPVRSRTVGSDRSRSVNSTRWPRSPASNSPEGPNSNAQDVVRHDALDLVPRPGRQIHERDLTVAPADSDRLHVATEHGIGALHVQVDGIAIGAPDGTSYSWRSPDRSTTTIWLPSK